MHLFRSVSKPFLPRRPSSFQPPHNRRSSGAAPANLKRELARGLSHLAALPMKGRARVNLSGEFAGRHVTLDYQQTADLALDASNPPAIGPKKHNWASIREGEGWLRDRKRSGGLLKSG
jgi:hypothetical protein